MSTLAYAALTRAKPRGREEAPTGIDHYIQVVMGLVPTEVLALHATILSFTTKAQAIKDSTTGKEISTTAITDPETLTVAFFGLAIVSALLFIVPQLIKKEWKPLDWIRTAVPPLAFVTWTALQKSTAFDAAFPGLQAGPRTVGALFLAAILTAVTAALPKEQSGGTTTLANGNDRRPIPKAFRFRKENVTVQVDE